MSNCIRDTKGHALHLPADQHLTRRKPFPSAPYYQYLFIVECAKCHARILVTCKTESEREIKMAQYPNLPRFPH